MICDRTVPLTDCVLRCQQESSRNRTGSAEVQPRKLSTFTVRSILKRRTSHLNSHRQFRAFDRPSPRRSTWPRSQIGSQKPRAKNSGCEMKKCAELRSSCRTHSRTTCLNGGEKRRDSASRFFARTRKIMLNAVRTILLRFRHEQRSPIVTLGERERHPIRTNAVLT